MRVLKGSHRPIMEHWGRQLETSRQASLPRVHGLRPADSSKDPEGFKAWLSEESIPELGPVPFREQEPTAMVARRGQAQCASEITLPSFPSFSERFRGRVFTQACLHAGWHNEDDVSRKAFIMSWMAKGVPGGMDHGRIEGIRNTFPEVHLGLSCPAERPSAQVAFR